MNRSLLLAASIALGLAAQTPPPPPATYQLPTITDAQHWNRASMHFILMFNAFIAREREQGRSAEEGAAYFYRLVGGGWGKDLGPKDMLEAMHTNFSMIPKTRFEVFEVTENRAHFRFSRAHVAYYGTSGEMFGVKPEAYEQAIATFHATIAAERGMTCELKREGDWLVCQIQRKPAAK